MTAHSFTEMVLGILADLSRDMPPRQRYARLLQALRGAFPCDAAALLRLDGQQLRPMAVSGLSDDTLGRRFEVEDHPRLARILLSREPVRFPADSDLPDPYDGLVENVEGAIHVHDCLGLSLYLDDVPWGVMTLDALQPDAFNDLDPIRLRTFMRLAEATIRIANLIDTLKARAEREQMVARTLVAEQVNHEMLGRSVAIETVRRETRVVADSDLTVLITGETGVGKELVARQIHHRSRRHAKPIVYVNCAALPENLVESELFGHAKGAFSDATSDRAGKFELAHGGTLFLDEIGELPMSAQPKLLRALQSGEIQRVGSDAFLQLDVRIIAATNRDLKKAVANGRFRADLYHRLGVYPIDVPPLRDRERDVLILAGHFLEQNRRRFGLQGIRLSATAQQALMAYDWPGNVRELEHLISRSVLRTRAAATSADDAAVLTITHSTLDLGASDGLQPQAPPPSTSQDPVIGNLSLREATDQFQIRMIREALAQNDGNQAAAARSLGIDRGNFSRLIKRLGIARQ